jgi:hypothetical protein
VRRLGVCPICISLCCACLALSLLVYGLGASLPLFPVAVAGIAGAAVFGPLALLHGIFYLLRPKIVPEPAPRDRLHPVTVTRAGCCGRWT